MKDDTSQLAHAQGVATSAESPDDFGAFQRDFQRYFQRDFQRYCALAQLTAI